MNVDLQQNVADLVLEHSECAAVFKRHRIDYCCRGNMSIEAACTEKGIDKGAMERELAAAIAERKGAPARDPREMSTPALIGHIITKHHEYLRKSLPFVESLAAKVSRVHGDHNPRLRELDTVVRELSAALLPHLDEEEQTLFPKLMSNPAASEALSAELANVHEEHLLVGALLERMRDATENYQLPDWACNSYRTLFSELSQLEGDVLEHVHLETHVLEPRFAKAS